MIFLFIGIKLVAVDFFLHLSEGIDRYPRVITKVIITIKPCVRIIVADRLIRFVISDQQDDMYPCWKNDIPEVIIDFELISQ